MNGHFRDVRTTSSRSPHPPSLQLLSLSLTLSPLSDVALMCQVMEICLQAQLVLEQQSWLPGDSFQSVFAMRFGIADVCLTPGREEQSCIRQQVN